MKVTKKQFEEYVANTKVYVSGRSDEIYQKLTDVGIISRDIPVNPEAPFIYIDQNADGTFSVSYGSNMSDFIKSENKRIEHNLILAVEIMEEKDCPFKPFDKVLVRYDKKHPWTAMLFSHLGIDRCGSLMYVCGSHFWGDCIPYNENTAHLVGTKEDFDAAAANSNPKESK